MLCHLNYNGITIPLMKEKKIIITEDGIAVRCAFDELVHVDDLKKMVHPMNPNQHPEEQVTLYRKIIRYQGFRRAITASQQSGKMTRGHGLLESCAQEGIFWVPVDWQSYDSEAQELADVLADNLLAELAEINHEMKWKGMRALEGVANFDMEFTGQPLAQIDWELKHQEPLPESKEVKFLAGPKAPEGPVLEPVKLADKFLVPPFSVLDARQGYWQNRKRAWLALGIQSEVGRGENLLKMSDTMLEPDPAKRAAMKSLGARSSNLDVESGHPYRRARSEQNNPATSFRDNDKMYAYSQLSQLSQLMKLGYSNDEAKRMALEEPERVFELLGMSPKTTGTSIFDPVLCELIYRWFSPVGAVILDPFAGGSVRGIVASRLGRNYVGVELRPEQVEANQNQAQAICLQNEPIYHCDSSMNLDEIRMHDADLVFSCPPYADLEVYSDDPRDISNMEYEKFLSFYRQIIAKALAKLKINRFACFVIGEVREKKGHGFYRNFVRDTVAAFEDAGARYYNEMILVTSVGTLPLRAGKVFCSGRKIGKTHQNVLVFCKGDPKVATEACGEVDVSNALEMFGEVVGDPAPNSNP